MSQTKAQLKASVYFNTFLIVLLIVNSRTTIFSLTVFNYIAIVLLFVYSLRMIQTYSTLEDEEKDEMIENETVISVEQE